MVLLTVGVAAFEGPAHPHKANILKYPGEKALDATKQAERIQATPASTETAAEQPAAR